MVCINLESFKVVKIAFSLVKSYDFTSQNMLCVLNRLKNQKWMKSGEIAKKSRFHDRFCVFTKTHKLKKIVPPMLQLSGAYWLCKCTVTPILQSLQSSLFTPVIARNKSLSSFSSNKSLISFSN